MLPPTMLLPLAFTPAVPLHFSPHKPRGLTHPCSRTTPRCSTNEPIAVTTVGNLSADVVLQVSSLPSHTGDHQQVLEPPKVDLGGSLNTLIAAHRLGAATAPVGYVAPPPSTTISAFLESAVRNFGFTSTQGIVPLKGFVTPTCTVLVERGGGHTFLATNEKPPSPPEGPLPTPQPLPYEMLDVIRRSQALVVDGYSISTEPALIHGVLSAAADLLSRSSLSPTNPMQLILDPQAVGGDLHRARDPLFSAVLAQATMLSLTEEEARQLAGVSSRASLDHLVTTLAGGVAPRASVIAVKRGADGCVVAYRASGRNSMWLVSAIPGFDVETRVVDSCGCGDAFLGGMLAGQALGMTVPGAAELGCAVGAATAMKVGGGVEGVATRDDVEEVLEMCESAIELPS